MELWSEANRARVLVCVSYHFSVSSEQTEPHAILACCETQMLIRLEVFLEVECCFRRLDDGAQVVFGNGCHYKLTRQIIIKNFILDCWIDVVDSVTVP